MVGDNLHISRVQIEVNERLAVVTGRGGGVEGVEHLLGVLGEAVPGYRGVEGHGGVDCQGRSEPVRLLG